MSILFRNSMTAAPGYFASAGSGSAGLRFSLTQDRTRKEDGRQGRQYSEIPIPARTPLSQRGAPPAIGRENDSPPGRDGYPHPFRHEGAAQSSQDPDESFLPIPKGGIITRWMVANQYLNSNRGFLAEFNFSGKAHYPSSTATASTSIMKSGLARLSMTTSVLGGMGSVKNSFRTAR